MANPYRPLEKTIGYRFRRKRRLALAFVHRSYRYETPEVEEDNQRLEYLGDAALGLVAAEHLFQERPDAQEGDLTQYRSLVTSTAALAEIAADVGAGAYLQLGKGERGGGGAERVSTLADTLEAVIGAAYVDGGLRAVRKIFNRLFVPRLDDEHVCLRAANPKGHLQEICQSRWTRSPRYETVRQTGPAHERVFHVEARLGDKVLGRGEGPNRRAAEAAAAGDAVARLERRPARRRRRRG